MTYKAQPTDVVDWEKLNEWSDQIGNLLKDRVSVLGYGAKGDGVADDWQKIMDCINNNPGKMIFFPPGVYLISKPLDITSHVVLSGIYNQSTIKAIAGFTGNYLLRNWKDSDYTVGETDKTLAPNNTANPIYYPHISNLKFNANGISGLNHIGWVHLHESGVLRDLTLDGANGSIGINLLANSDTDGSFNGGFIENVTFYGTGWKTSIRGYGSGSDLHLSKITTAPSAHSDSVFFFRGQLDVTMDNIHIEGYVEPTTVDTDPAIIRLTNVKGFSITDSFHYFTATLNHSFIHSTNTNTTGYGVTSPSIINLQTDNNGGAGSFSVPYVKDRSQSVNTQDISYVSRINYYDGNILSTMTGSSGEGEVKLLRRDKTPSACRAYQSAGQSIAAATFTKVAFNVEDFDNRSEYDPALYRFTASQEGYYSVSASVRFATQVDGNRTILSVYKNGATEYARIYEGVIGGASTSIASGVTVLKLAKNDYIEIQCFTANAVSTSSGSGFTYLAVTRIS